MVHEERWISTQCGRCYANCGIRVRRVNGVAVKIEGEPNSTMGAEGGLCAKGSAGIQVLYDPNRLNRPLKRTNPEKGLSVDPKWKEITWEEALEEILPRMERIIRDQPRKLLMQSSTIRPCRLPETIPFSAVTGPTSMFIGGGGLHCGQGAHPMAGIVHGSWSVVPDFRYCNYAIYFGASKGHGSGHSAMITARLAAEAKSRGMKLVVFDPICNFAGGKANEWIPIIPGTDAAVVLAMCNVIINELGEYDEKFIKEKTNGPYLIGPDGRYVRQKGRARGIPGTDVRTGEPVTYIGDDESNKPMVWDRKEGRAKVYDDPSIGDFALEGEYQYEGIPCRPAFDLVKEHLKTYTCERASEISSVPSGTIHRIAEEFLEAAQLGSTIRLQGHELPYRPASAVLFRGGQGHENSHHTCFAVALLNSIIGGCDVPGGTLGWPARCLGFPDTGKPRIEPWKGVDGFLQIEHFGPSSGAIVQGHGPWPVALPRNANQLGLTDVFSLAPFPFVFGSSDQEELWRKIGTDYRIEMMLVWGCNSVISTASREILDETLRKIPFIAVFELFNTELTEGYADIVLPDTCYLEELHWSEGLGMNFNHAFGMDDWCYHIVQPVVDPVPERREYVNVLYDVADRLGRRSHLNEAMNRLYGLEGERRIGPEEKLFIEDIADRALRNLFGDKHDLEWFKEHGFLRWPKKVEEAYWRYFIDARVPIYIEYLLDVGAKLKEIDGATGLGVDLSQYTPLISWFPCTIHRGDSEYDLYCYSYRDVLHTGSSTMEQPWLDEASRMNPYTYHITINSRTASEKGIRDGDLVEIESAYGRKVRGPVKLMEGQHPRTIGIAACSGHWAKGMPIARGKGTNFDTLIENDLEHCDPVSLNLETAVRVRVRAIE
ncbi:MAG: molybdopterin-dependent oxidoreductase [Deltaproteobacteria bacterium]|nr:molybdopterin-dependent oxidoreductase [Deltaproteobacteria bacterium]MBW2136372.1 molybdopterin-dependent oxidoreductase [Deltaproteobacteria bacterium]